MGSCFSIPLPWDQVVNWFSQRLSENWSYIHNLEENLANLKNAMDELKKRRDDVQKRVKDDVTTFKGLCETRVEVTLWLDNIETIKADFDNLISTSEIELERLYLCGVCSENLVLSFQYGQRVSEILKNVERLNSQGAFVGVTRAVLIAEVEELPIEPTIVGQETMLETVWNRLMDDKIGIVGLYGMGGVGKTTLLKQINNKLRGRFDVVIWVVVSKDATVHKIQGELGKKLDLSGDEWDKKSENQRASDIQRILMKKKFVLLLDDIWEKVFLNEVGVPYPNNKNGCKVAFTTRSREVCGRMGVVDPIQVCCLDREKALDLFKKKVGERTLSSHPDIPELAEEVARECRGLPLALTVIGETMSSRSKKREWEQAVKDLKSYASEFKGMEDEILPVLKYSYDSLKDEQVKSCFLYCSLFPEDSLMGEERLIEYWICEGFIDENKSREKALEEGYDILGTLVRACLLLEEIDEFNREKVKMHDVVRDMALWIASDLGKHKERCIVQAGVGLREIPKEINWESVRRMSLMENKIDKISESHECPELTTLLLGANKSLATIPGEFFRCMHGLLVLDLSGNTRLRGLPEEISRLVSLRYLDLSGTSIERLHLEKLKMLIHLDLEWTRELESLQGISHLSSLRTLKLWDSNLWLDMSLMKELQLLEHLEFITVTITSSLVGEKILNDSRVWRCIEKASISGRQGESVRVINMPAMENLREVYIEDREILGEIKIEKRGGWNKSLTSPCLFSNLSRVVIEYCDGLKDLTWLLFAPNLTCLWVVESEKIEEIISEEKAASLLEKGTDIIPPFQKLKILELEGLPELKSIYWNTLPFPRLKSLTLNDCPKLRKLPLDSKSVDKVEDLEIEYNDEEWKERVEWLDEATRQRFMGNFTRR